jgi:hypothetical protein
MSVCRTALVAESRRLRCGLTDGGGVGCEQAESKAKLVTGIDLTIKRKLHGRVEAWTRSFPNQSARAVAY